MAAAVLQPGPENVLEKGRRHFVVLLVGRIDGNCDGPVCEGLEQRFLLSVTKALITPYALTKPPFEEAPDAESNGRIWKCSSFGQTRDDS